MSVYVCMIVFVKHNGMVFTAKSVMDHRPNDLSYLLIFSVLRLTRSPRIRLSSKVLSIYHFNKSTFIILLRQLYFLRPSLQDRIRYLLLAWSIRRRRKENTTCKRLVLLKKFYIYLFLLEMEILANIWILCKDMQTNSKHSIRSRLLVTCPLDSIQHPFCC